VSLSLSEIVGALADEFDAELLADAQTQIQSLSSLESATPHSLSFISHAKYLSQLTASAAACVIVPTEIVSCRGDMEKLLNFISYFCSCQPTMIRCSI
jgi:UDP-3-O-[3-hydroxymyristoyl] glucosamine N-acyltransferase